MEEKGSSPKKQNLGAKDICYRLVNPIINFSTQRATCKIKIPSDSLPRYVDPVDDPEGVLVVKNANEDNLRCIKIMRECTHKNILHALVVAKQDDYFLVWTEFYTDSVLNYLQSTTAFGVSNTFASRGTRIILPTASLQSFVSHAFSGLEYLWSLGKYHGNLTLKNTYYQILGVELVVKLAGFKLKARETKRCQAEDCQAIGLALESVSEAAKARKAKGQNFDCYIIDDLTRRLKEFAWGDLPYIKQDIYGHPFFWNKDDIKYFFVSQIPIAMNSQAFRDKVINYEELCTLPWGEDGFDGFVLCMDKYRLQKNMDKYNKRSRLCYVQFLSGLYVHEEELQAGPVDEAINKRSPLAFMMLYNLIPRPPRLTSE